MKLSSLSNLLSGTMSATDYSAEIAGELAEHVQGLSKRGSARVVVTEDIDFVLDPAGLSALCRLFASGQITASELAYTADALELAERVEFSEPDIADDLAECTDPEINGPLTVSRALELASQWSAA
jgi:hypothetical protein